MDDSRWRKGFLLFGWTLVLIGLSYASIVATGSELGRLALIIPPLFLGTVFCVLFGPRRRDCWWLFAIGLVSGYLLLRGGISPIWDLARRDLFLIVAGLLGYLAASSALRLRTGRFMFLGVVSLLILGNATVAFYQWQVDSSFAFLRSARGDTQGVSGFYFHRNYLAGFFEIACPLLLAAVLGQKLWLARLSLAVPLVLGVGCSLLTNSRGGFGALVSACLVVIILWKLRERNPTAKRSRLSVVKATLLVMVGIALVFGARYGWDSIVETRGGGEATDGSLSVRLRMAGIAFDIWLKNPLLGMGAESYSYLFPKFFAGMAGWVGDAQMAHSEYLQLLTDYGLVGLLAVVFLILGLAFFVFRPLEEGDSGSLDLENGYWLRSAACGVIVAEVLRAAFDFNLHIAPNLILFAMVVAGGVSFSSPARSADPTTTKLGFARILAVVLALGTGGYAMKAGWKETLAVKDWMGIEALKLQKKDDTGLLRIYSEKAPSFRNLRLLARRSLADAIRSKRREDFELAANDWKKVVARHPLDGESLANYARSLDELNNFDLAAKYHARALEAVGRRENKYGVIHGVGWHFARRGHEAAEKRQPGKALFLYLNAKEAFEESNLRNFSRVEYNRAALKWVEERIKFLEGARIDAEPVEVLDWKSKLL